MRMKFVRMYKLIYIVWKYDYFKFEQANAYILI